MRSQLSMRNAISLIGLLVLSALWGCTRCPECPPAEPCAAADSTSDGDTDSAPLDDTAGDSDTGVKAAPVGGKPKPVTDYHLHGRAGFERVNVWQEPDMDSPRLGYLRRGSRIRVGDPHYSSESCPQGWFKLETGGYACQGKGLLVGEKPRAIPRPPPPPRVDMLDPYPHGFIRADWTPSYKRIPTEEEMWRLPERESADTAAPEVAEAPRDSEDDPTRPPPTIEVIPHATAKDTDTPDGVDYYQYARRFKAVQQLMSRGFWVAVQERLRDDDTRQYYYQTVKGAFVPANAVHLVRPPEFRGHLVRGDTPMPAVIVRANNAAFFQRRNQRFVGAGRAERLMSYSVLSESGTPGNRYFEIEGNRWLKESQVSYFPMRTELPEGVRENEKWIRIDLTEQTLEAWEGLMPILMTLVSSGLGDTPEKETPTGRFRINFKHLTDDMTGSVGDGTDAYQVEDVPWVQYIHLNIAFHAAFWHSRFGQPKSHGCINLAPADARTLFDWTDPPLPEAWHGVLSTEAQPGTLVIIEGKTPGAGRQR